MPSRSSQPTCFYPRQARTTRPARQTDERQTGRRRGGGVRGRRHDQASAHGGEHKMFVGQRQGGEESVPRPLLSLFLARAREREREWRRGKRRARGGARARAHARGRETWNRRWRNELWPMTAMDLSGRAAIYFNSSCTLSSISSSVSRLLAPSAARSSRVVTG